MGPHVMPQKPEISGNLIENPTDSTTKSNKKSNKRFKKYKKSNKKSKRKSNNKSHQKYNKKSYKKPNRKYNYKSKSNPNKKSNKKLNNKSNKTSSSDYERSTSTSSNYESSDQQTIIIEQSLNVSPSDNDYTSDNAPNYVSSNHPTTLFEPEQKYECNPNLFSFEDPEDIMKLWIEDHCIYFNQKEDILQSFTSWILEQFINIDLKIIHNFGIEEKIQQKLLDKYKKEETVNGSDIIHDIFRELEKYDIKPTVYDIADPYLQFLTRFNIFAHLPPHPPKNHHQTISNNKTTTLCSQINKIKE